MQLLALCGSLRAASSNSILLQACRRLAPANVQIMLYPDMGLLPHFNPDLENQLSPIVADLRSRIAQADGLLISCPEYARGIPGSFKNLLDWLVASTTFPGKPVMLLNASPRACAAQAALRLVLNTMSAQLIDEAAITVQLLAKNMDEQQVAADTEIAEQLTQGLQAFVLAIRKHQETTANP